MSDLASLEQRALAELQECGDETALRAWNTKYFGEKGEVQLALKELSKLPKEDRRAYGQQVNQVKTVLTQAYEQAVAKEKELSLERSLTSEALDVTLPGRPAQRGRLHVSTQTLRLIYGIFADM